MLPASVTHLIQLIKKMPGLGEKSARRLVFYLLQQGPQLMTDLSNELENLRDKVTLCHRCGNLTETQPCSVCADPLRDHGVLCVVESLEDLAAIESSGVYRGLYFNLALGQSLLEDRDILPEDRLTKLKVLIQSEPVNEIIIATNPRIEGDVTFYALVEALEELNIPMTRLAYGLPVGGTIEFADRTTLHAALERRRSVNDMGFES